MVVAFAAAADVKRRLLDGDALPRLIGSDDLQRRFKLQGSFRHGLGAQIVTFGAASPATAVLGQFEKKHPSGAKSPDSFCSICGTTKVVPFQDSFNLRHPSTSSGRAKSRALSKQLQTGPLPAQRAPRRFRLGPIAARAF